MNCSRKRGLSTGDINVASSGGCDINGDDGQGPFTQVRARRAKKSKKASSQQVQSLASADRCGVSQPKSPTCLSPESVLRFPHAAADTQADCCRNCERNESIIESLKCELNQLKESVKSLTSQVEMLTSSLGLKSADMTTSSQTQLSQSSVLNNTTAAAAAVKSYASVAANPSRSIRDVQLSIVSAVYKDKEDKKKRANNIVVSGLTIDEQFDSKAVVAGMILQEFGREVTVKSCRRLGVPVSGKPPNILVTLSSAEDASHLVSNAKILRHSGSELVRSKVFVNADLTPAEAKAAYELRCARRQRAAANQDRRGGAGPITSQQTETAVNTSQLSASATPFVPPSSPSVADQQHRMVNSTAEVTDSSLSANMENIVQRGRHR